jgi:hypothetical protein
MTTYQYQTIFSPTDSNLSAEDCMEIYHYPTRVEALAAAARDAMETASSEGATPEGRAYMRAAAALIECVAREALADIDPTIGREVSVDVNGTEARTIGAYIIEARDPSIHHITPETPPSVCAVCGMDDWDCDAHARLACRDTCPACNGTGTYTEYPVG